MDDDQATGPKHAPEPATALAPILPPTPTPKLRYYHVPLSPAQVLDRLCEQPGVKAYEQRMVPDFGGLVEDAEYTLELGSREFTLHTGPPAARGQSATGMLRLLYLCGRMTRTNEGTLIELRFAYRRPRWALQRWVGFLALASLGLLWVLIGPGIMVKKALLYGVLLLVLGPVVAHDLRRGDRIEEQRRALLNLIEHSFGAMQLAQPHPDEPYRRRGLSAASLHDRDPDDDDPDEDDSDDDHSNEDGAKTPENT